MFQAVCKHISRRLVISNPLITSVRYICVTTARPVKDVVEIRDGKTLILDADVKDSGRSHRLYKPEDNRSKACPLCALGLNVKHTDVLILEQFMRPNGSVIPRRTTGLCKVQQRRVSIMVAMAIQAGLMPTHGNAGGCFNTLWFHNYKRFNSYFDEDTIEPTKHALRVKRRATIQRLGDEALAEEKLALE